MFFPQVDDSLDVFICHGVGAVAGALVLGFFASTAETKLENILNPRIRIPILVMVFVEQ